MPHPLLLILLPLSTVPLGDPQHNRRIIWDIPEIPSRIRRTIHTYIPRLRHLHIHPFLFLSSHQTNSKSQFSGFFGVRLRDRLISYWHCISASSVIKNMSVSLSSPSIFSGSISLFTRASSGKTARAKSSIEIISSLIRISSLKTLTVIQNTPFLLNRDLKPNAMLI